MVSSQKGVFALTMDGEMYSRKNVCEEISGQLSLAANRAGTAWEMIQEPLGRKANFTQASIQNSNIL